MENNDVSINIPYDNPLYRWVIENVPVFMRGGTLPYATLSVDDVECRLALTTVNHHCYVEQDCYLDTQWVLLRSEPKVRVEYEVKQVSGHMMVCKLCGALVAHTADHTAWHGKSGPSRS